MIQRIELDRFRGFHHFGLDFAPFTLLGGQNGVGKTSVLDSIFVFFDRWNPGLLQRQMAFRGMLEAPARPETLLGPLFYDQQLSEDVVIRMTWDDTSEIVRLSFCDDFDYALFGGVQADHPVDELSTSSRSQRPALRVSYECSTRPAATAFLSIETETPAGYPARIVQAGQKLEKDNRTVHFIGARHMGGHREDAQRFGELDRQRRSGEVVEFLREFDSRIRDLAVIPYSDLPVIHADIGLSSLIPISYLGEGISRILSIYLAMMGTGASVLLVDEIGSGIHYSLLPMLWRGLRRAARAAKCQVIATTHSLECVSAAIQADDGLFGPSLSYVRLDRVGKEIVPKVYSGEALHYAITEGWEVR